MKLPINSIAYWPGSVASIPADWQLCDGTAGTIDMRNLMVRAPIGIGPGGAAGGLNTHNHALGTVIVDLAGNHTHTFSTIANHDHGAVSGAAGTHSHGAATGNVAGHTHVTNATTHNHTLVGSASSNTVPDHFHGVGGIFSGSIPTTLGSTPGANAIPGEPHGHSMPDTANAGTHSHTWGGSLYTDNEIVHVNTITTASPVHNHSVSVVANHTHSIIADGSHANSVTLELDHNHPLVGAIDPANNIPAYVELHLIMRVA